MKKSAAKTGLALMLLGCIIFSSCIGSFSLSKKMVTWNREVSVKPVNELIFLALAFVQVYTVTILADALVINSIEFWSGKKPLADDSHLVKVTGKNGEYSVQRTPNGYHIENMAVDMATDLLFDETEQSWNVVTSEGEIVPLLKFNENNQVLMYLPNDKQVPVELSKEGVMAFRGVVINNMALH